MQNIRAITLDLDDTLWAVAPVIERAEVLLWEWLTEHYPAIPEKFSREDVAALREGIVEKYWKDRSHDLGFLRRKVLENLATESGYSTALVEPAFAVFDAARNDVELFPDVLPSLANLCADYTLIAVTNGNASLEKIGIRHHFHGVVTAVDVGAAKPAKAIFNVAVRAAGVARTEILHVGDHPITDIDGGRRAGLRTAWVNRTGAEWPADLVAPDMVVTKLPEIAATLCK